MAKAKGERAPLVGAAVLRTPDLSSLTVQHLCLVLLHSYDAEPEVYAPGC